MYSRFIVSLCSRSSPEDVMQHRGPPDVLCMTILLTLQDLSRPSDSSAASLARMIGGLALAGTTAAIADQPKTPKGSRSQTAGLQPGSFLPSSSSRTLGHDLAALGSQAAALPDATAGAAGQWPDGGHTAALDAPQLYDDSMLGSTQAGPGQIRQAVMAAGNQSAKQPFRRTASGAANAAADAGDGAGGSNALAQADMQGLGRRTTAAGSSPSSGGAGVSDRPGSATSAPGVSGNAEGTSSIAAYRPADNTGGQVGTSQGMGGVRSPADAGQTGLGSDAESNTGRTAKGDVSSSAAFWDQGPTGDDGSAITFAVARFPGGLLPRPTQVRLLLMCVLSKANLPGHARHGVVQ